MYILKNMDVPCASGLTATLVELEGQRCAARPEIKTAIVNLKPFAAATDTAHHLLILLN